MTSEDGVASSTSGVQPEGGSATLPIRTFSQLTMDEKREYLKNIADEVRLIASARDRTELQKIVKKFRDNELPRWKPFLEENVQCLNWSSEKLTEEDYQNIKPKIVLVSNDFEKKLWEFWRVYGCSFAHRGSVGKAYNYLLFDDRTKKLLGITSLNSPPPNMDARDTYFNILDLNCANTILNIGVCVPLQPFGTFAGGKLLTLLMSSKEIVRRVEEDWKRKIVGIYTTSLYRRSVQYEDIPRWEYVGLSSGFGTIHLGDVNINELYAELGGSAIETNGVWRLNYISKKLNLPDLNKHNLQRGIYCRRLYEHGEVSDYMRAIHFQKTNDDTLLKTPTGWTIKQSLIYWREHFFNKRFAAKKSTIPTYWNYYEKMNNLGYKLQRIKPLTDYF
jgi:hypothetical protein